MAKGAHEMNEKTARIGKNSNGLYLLDNGNYPPAICRIGAATTGKLWVINDNPAYPSHTVERIKSALSGR